MVDVDFVREVVPGKAILTVLEWVWSLEVTGLVCVCFFAGLFVLVSRTVFLAADLAAAIATYL
jgi:hypothetical protein